MNREPHRAGATSSPARANGGGLRSLVKSAPAAFAATVAKIAPKLIESKDDQGAVRRGFLDGVAGMISLFGDGLLFVAERQPDFPWGGPGRLASSSAIVPTLYRRSPAYEFRFDRDGESTAAASRSVTRRRGGGAARRGVPPRSVCRGRSRRTRV